MQVGEERGVQVELFKQNLLGDWALAVVLNGVFCGGTAFKHTRVVRRVLLLEPDLCAPPVPQCAENCGANPGRYQSF